jgi:hypothetical protein
VAIELTTIEPSKTVCRPSSYVIDIPCRTSLNPGLSIWSTSSLGKVSWFHDMPGDKVQGLRPTMSNEKGIYKWRSEHLCSLRRQRSRGDCGPFLAFLRMRGIKVKNRLHWGLMGRWPFGNSTERVCHFEWMLPSPTSVASLLHRWIDYMWQTCPNPLL